MSWTSGSETPISVLVVDDHRVFADALALRLAELPGIAEVRTASNLAVARALVNTMRPQVVLLDYRLGPELGLDLFADLDRLGEARPWVVMVAATREPGCIVEALRAGSHGWVMKDGGFEHLVEAIDTVLTGQLALPGPATELVVRHLLTTTTRPAREPSFLDELTAREFEVLRCLVTGMNRREVAEHLFISVNTVRTHIQNLLHHSGQHSTLALVAAARRLGVTDVGDASPASSVPGPRQSPK